MSAQKIMSPADMQADIAERVADFEPDQAAQFRRAVEFVLHMSALVLEAPEHRRAELYQGALADGAALGLDVRFLPERYDATAEKDLRGMRLVGGNAELATRGAHTAH